MVLNEGVFDILEEGNFQSREDYLNATYQHFAERAQRRYRKAVSRGEWDVINERLKNKDALFIGYKNIGAAELWLCNGFVVLYLDVARTVLPFMDYSLAVKRAKKEKNNNLKRLCRGKLYSQSKTFLDAKALASLFYNLDLTEEMWSEIKKQVPNSVLVKKWKHDKIIRISYASRKLFLTLRRDDVETLKIARPSFELTTSMSPTALLSKAIRKQSLSEDN